MKVLFKYISKLFVTPFFIGLGGFIVFVSVEILYQLSSIIVRHRVGISKLFLLIYYYLPYFTAMGIPVGVLLAIFWIVTELSTKRELMAFQVHGIPLKKLVYPFLFISSLLSVFAFLLNDTVVPKYQEKAEEVLAKYIYRKAGVEAFLVENTLAKYENQYLYIRRYDEKRGIIEGVVLFRYNSGGEEIITADRVVKEGKDWYLINGKYYRVNSEGFLKFDSQFKRLKLDIGEDLETFLKVKKPSTMTGKELREKIKALKKLGVNPSSWLVELHTRYSTALAPLIIVLVGLSLSLTFNLRSKSWGVILTFLLVVLYQGSGAWLSAMGKEKLIDPILSAWLPDISFTLVGLALFTVLGTKFEYRLREFLSRLFVVALFFVISGSGFSETMNVISDRTLISERVATFTGDVTFRYEDIEILASTATAFFTEDGQIDKVKAWQVKLLEKGRSMESEFLVFYPDSSLTYMYVVTGELETEMGKLKVSANRLLKTDDWVTLTDNVNVKIEDVIVKGNFLKIILKNGEISKIFSSSPVAVRGKTKDGSYEILGSYLIVDPESSSMEFGDFTGNFSYREGKKTHILYDSGSKLITTEEGITISGGGITTCSLKNPHYSISASKIAYKYGAYIAAEHAVLIVLGVPVFYFPYFFTTISDEVKFQMGFSFSAKSSVSTFSFSQKYSKTGNMVLERTLESKEGGADKYGFKLSDKIGDFGVIFDQGFSIRSGRIYGLNTSLKVSTPYFSKPVLVLKDSKDHSIQAYSLSGNLKFTGKGKLTYVISRTYSKGKVSYLIPSVKVSKFSFGFFGGKVTLKSLTHKSTLSFKEGTIIDHLDDVKSSGKIQMSYGRTIFKSFGTSLGFSNTTIYDFEGATPVSYSLNTSASLKLLSGKFKFGGLEISPVQNIGLNMKLSKDSTPALSFSENTTVKSSLKLGFFSLSANYIRSNAYSETNEPSSKRKHILSLSSNLNAGFVGTKFGVSTSYDFLKPESERLSNPLITTDTNLNLSGLNLSLKTKTPYNYKEGVFGKTDLEIGSSYSLEKWKFSGSVKSQYDHSSGEWGKLGIKLTQIYSGGKFSNVISFSYDQKSDSPVKEILDTFTTKKLDLYTFTNVKLSGQFKFGLVPEVRLKYFKIKGSFSAGKAKNGLALTYSSKSPSLSSISLSYSLASFDPQIKLSLKGSRKDGEWSFNRISLSLKKDLHCWFVELAGTFRYSKGFLVDGLSFKFYIKEFPSKFFSYDLKSGVFNLNFF